MWKEVQWNDDEEVHEDSAKTVKEDVTKKGFTHQFLGTCGPTKGCHGCERAPGSCCHTAECRKRQQEFRAGQNRLWANSMTEPTQKSTLDAQERTTEKEVREKEGE